MIKLTMNGNVTGGLESLEKKVMEHARNEIKARTITAANEVKESMGADGADLVIDYQEKQGGDEIVGSLNVKGPDEALAKFQELFKVRMGS